MTVAELDQAVLSSPPFVDSRLFDNGGNRYFARLVRLLHPKYVVELGTGVGRTAAMIAAALPETSCFATVNWPNPPSGDDVGRELVPFLNERITQILGDSRDCHVHFADNSIDLLYIDSGTTHEYALISEEWRLYAPKLVDGAIVVADDIHFAGSDMERFWDPLPYDKVEIMGGSAGMFRYERSK